VLYASRSSGNCHGASGLALFNWWDPLKRRFVFSLPLVCFFGKGRWFCPHRKGFKACFHPFCEALVKWLSLWGNSQGGARAL
jgi:hypothetical protein